MLLAAKQESGEALTAKMFANLLVQTAGTPSGTGDIYAAGARRGVEGGAGTGDIEDTGVIQGTGNILMLNSPPWWELGRDAQSS